MTGNVAEYISPPSPNFFDLSTTNIVTPACVGGDLQDLDDTFNSAVWTANLLIAVPLITQRAIIVSQFFWYNGTVAAGNTDVGIFNLAGTSRLGSTGSTANSGTSQIQVVDVANFTIGAEQRFWLVLGSDDGTHTYFLNNLSAQGLDYIGVKQHASGWSSGLPSSITLGTPSVAKLPLFGFTKGAI